MGMAKIRLDKIRFSNLSQQYFVQPRDNFAG